MNVQKELISKLSKEYSDFFQLDDIKKILDISDEPEQGLTFASGAHLELSKIKVNGYKDGNSDGKFEYERVFRPGVNTLIADNLKGKSTIFKCIKYALTGRNSLKKDVLKWIDHIYLEFMIGEHIYTSHIDNTGKRIKASLYKAKLSGIETKSTKAIDIVCSNANKEEYEEKLQAFFYKKLGIETLKWTQKSPKKDDNRLLEARTSWRTFFKTIYLESKDTNTLMYGAQEGLLIQVLLGLGLTTSINNFKIRKELLEFETSIKANMFSVGNTETKLPEEITSELNTLINRLNEINATNPSNNIDGIIEKKSQLITEVQKYEERRLRKIKEKSQTEDELTILSNEQQIIEKNLLALKKGKGDLEKNIHRIEEHIEVGSFFANLDIKSCPSCNTGLVVEAKTGKKLHSCTLCHHEISNQGRQQDVSRMKAKLSELKSNLNGLVKQIDIVEEEFRIKQKELSDKKSKNLSQNFTSNAQEIDNLLSSIKKLDSIIINEQNKSLYQVSETKKIEGEIAVLKYRLINSQTFDSDNKDEIKKRLKEVELLEKAIIFLEETRSSQNLSVIEAFKKFILDILHSLGLKSFTAIEIDNKLRIRYKQGGETISFSDITEGEQLRVKMATYLALVMLNSEHGVGNHPRMLIIDSPGKEEADNKYFEGFIDALRIIEKEFQDKIQIFVGSADRRLVDAFPDKQEVKPAGEAVF